MPVDSASKYGNSFPAVILQLSSEQFTLKLVCNLVSFQHIRLILNLREHFEKLWYVSTTSFYTKIFSLILLSDRAVVLCHYKADIHHRLQHFLSGASHCCVDPVALQVGTDNSQTQLVIKCCFHFFNWIMFSFLGGGGHLVERFSRLNSKWSM